MASRWINERVRRPAIDGEYIVQNVHGRVFALTYTVEYGWNTYIGSDGQLIGSTGYNDDGYVVRWYDLPKPPRVSKAAVEEYMEKINA